MGITDTFSRSWEITKKTFHVMKLDKEILLFPILSSVFSIILFLLLVFPFLLTALTVTGKADDMYAIYLGIFGLYFISAFSATFFNVGIVHIAKTRFQGGDATFMDGIKIAGKHLKHIIGWSLLTATVGLLLNILESQSRKKGGVGAIIGRIAASLLGMAWAIVSIFVVPAMVIKGIGPIDALKSSVQTIKKTWGESLVRHYGLGIVRTIVSGIGVFLFLLPGIYSFFVGSMNGGFILIGIFIVYLLIVSVIFSSANTIFNTALFLYADEGKVPEYFSKEELSHAFVKK
ncbi:MAG: DUF6159 family protein [Candidatus Woesearchaeota archaeon]